MSLTPISSLLIADTGISMGDEGKGRLIPELIQELRENTGRPEPVAIVMKVNGGANSGHTAGGLKLNLLPAGVIDASVSHLLLGAGVVADPRKILWEARPLEAVEYPILSRLVIDERTMVSDLCHRLLDLAWEDYRVHVLGQEARGSTGRGISPAYADEVSQFQIHYADLLGPQQAFADKLKARADRALRTIQHVCQVPRERFAAFFDRLSEAELRANQAAVDAGIFPAEEFDFSRFRGSEAFSINTDVLVSTYWQAGRSLADNIRDGRELCMEALTAQRYIIGEFGQSYWLDKRAGFPPNVTASHTFTAEFFQSAGIPVQPVHNIGCCKAYDTKVGTHLFLTRMEPGLPLTRKLEQLEFGTSTGRQRMVGWFDAVEKGEALRYGGCQDIVINKLDALTCDHGGEAVLKVCHAYRTPDGEILHQVPRQDALRGQLQPVYAELKAWQEDLSGVRRYADLPQAARDYIAFCLQAIHRVASRGLSNCPPPNIRYIGVGPDPSQIIRDVPSADALLAK